MKISKGDKPSETHIEGPSNQKFGFTFSFIFFSIGFIYWYLKGRAILWPWTFGSIFLGLALFMPKWLEKPNLFWLKFGLLLHQVISPIILGVMFFLVITPIGVLMRVFGKCPIQKNYNAKLTSYWIDRDPPGPDPDSMRDQF